MSERQTISYLQTRFRAAGLQPQTKFGQNFLIDLNLVQMIADTAQLSERDVVLEVGNGMGSLTNLLAAKAGHVVTIEIDHHLARLAEYEFQDRANVTLVQRDALQGKNRLAPEVIDTLREHLSNISGSRLKLVANLPYNVATPILSNLLDMEALANSNGCDNSKRACAANYGKTKNKGLQCFVGLDASSVQNEYRPHHATERVLASPESRFGNSRHPTPKGNAAKDKRSQVLPSTHSQHFLTSQKVPSLGTN